jgi:cytochrome c2
MQLLNFTRWIISFTLLVFPYAVEAEESTNISEVSLTDPLVKNKLANLEPITKTVDNDPFYGGTHTYRGYPLKAALAALLSDEIVQRPEVTISFLCSDGFLKTVRLSDLPLDQGILAFEEVGLPANQRWKKVAEGREYVDPAPFAVMWGGRYEPGSMLPWPISIVQISAASSAGAPPAAPLDAHTREGYIVFQKHCQPCHSVNLDGGNVGPELNVPRNITEYWNESDIRSLIIDPNSYHWGSRMPAFGHLPNNEIDALLAYLRGMKAKKACSSKDECSRYSPMKR